MTTTDIDLNDHLHQLLAAIQLPLHLDRWDIRLSTGALPDARAACNASPEYREANVKIDMDRVLTGDDLAELVVHECGAHPHTWPLHAVAEQLADMVADAAPPYMRDGLRTLLQEQVRRAAEQVTTDVGQTYLRLLRAAGHLPPLPADTAAPTTE